MCNIPCCVGSASIRIVSRSLGLSGTNIRFKSEPFFGLEPNSEIIQIGNGKENGTIRTDKFSYPVKYVGSIICQFEKEEKMFAFQLPEKNADEDIFLLYGSTGSQIFTEAVTAMKNKKSGKPSGYLRVYAPEFVVVEGANQEQQLKFEENE